MIEDTNGLESEVTFLGAAASNAGDAFHEQWVARQLLALLEPGADDLSITVEGLPPDRAPTELGDHAQAVDVTLTRGEAGARQNHFLQLKYSPSHSRTRWTWARLTRPARKNAKDSSVLGKLAGLMRAAEFRGTFEIVSNQRLAGEVSDDIAAMLAGGDDLPDDPPEIATTLQERFDLTGRDLVRFLRAWKLEGFGSVSRLQLQAELVQRIAAVTDADAGNDAESLLSHVRLLMLPEGQRHGAINRETLLIWLGAGSEEIFFPAPSRIAVPSPLLPRKVARDLADLLRAPASRPVRVHADGGCGKTSTVSTIGGLLPKGSEVLVYDCYGGGLFLASDEKRHLASRAFTQMGNELAARLKTPFVIRRNDGLSPFDAFRRRVAGASELIADRDPEALLVLCFDAVDNARIGAIHHVESCFLDELAGASAWPVNVRIVVTCRTARLEDVGAAQTYNDFEVAGFDTDEARAFVALHQSRWPEALADTLHDLTGGNPRRLAYALEGLGPDDQQAAITRLLPRAAGIDPLFAKRVEEAGIRLGGPERVWPLLSALARLPRPIPSETLAAIAGLSAADVADIARDVGGIILHSSGWSFHDEDFEAFVAQHTKDEADALLSHAADVLSARLDTDRYAATAIGEVFVASGRLRELFALVTKPDGPPLPLSPAEAEHVRSRRLALSLRACQQAADIGTACELLIASAEAGKQQELLNKLIVENLDLAVRFESDAAMRLVMTGRGNRALRGRLRVQFAAALAQSDPAGARSHYRWWREYLRDRALSDEHKMKIEARDLAADVRVHAELRGPLAGIATIQQWRPASHLAAVFRLLAQEEAGRNPDVLREALGLRAWPPRAAAPILAAALLAGGSLSEPILTETFAKLGRATAARWGKRIDPHARHTPALSWHEALLFVCERAVSDHAHHATIRTVLERAFPFPQLAEPSDLNRLRSAGALNARVLALHERLTGKPIDLADWLPPAREVPQRKRGNRQTDAYTSGREERSPEAHWNETREETLEAFGRMLAAARVTLDLVIGTVLAGDAEQAFSRALAWGPSHRRQSRDSGAATLLVRAFLFHAGLTGLDLTAMRAGMVATLKSWGAASDSTLIALAEALTLMPSGHDAALAWLSDVSSEVAAGPGAASDRAKLIVDCARAALPLDENLAKALFASALSCTAQVDYEALSELATCHAIARAGLGGDRNTRADLARQLGETAGAVAATLEIGGDFPWQDIGAAIAETDLATGLATIARWHDAGAAAYERTLPELLTSPAARKLSAAQRYALGLLCGSDRPQITALAQSHAMPEAILAADLHERLLSGSITTFADALNDVGQLSGAERSDARQAAELTRTHLLALRPAPEPAIADDPDEAESEIVVPAPQALRSTREIDDAMASLAADTTPMRERRLLAVAERIQSRALRVHFLDLASESPGDRGDLGLILPELLARWSDYPPVAQWARERVGIYVARSLRHLFEWRYEDTDVLEAVLEATGLPSADQAMIVLEAIAYNAETISAELVFALIGVVAARADPERPTGLLRSLLDHIAARTARPAEVTLAGIDVPDDPDQAAARLLFAAMGDIDKRMRWRAAHAALLLIRARDAAVRSLVEQLGAVTESSFSIDHFYLYAAREQLMIVLRRAAAEAPEYIAGFAGEILACLREDPHVIVRELGRSLIRDLVASGALELTPVDAAFVDGLNRSPFSPIAQQGRSLRPASFHTEDKKRAFHFDSMDTVRYWYQQPAALFGLDMGSFLDRIEAWVHGKWGYGETSNHWLEEPRLDRLERDEKYLSHRHGHRPTVERLSRYLEWHGMMCAVGELIETHPMVSDDRYGDSFAQWLARSLPTIDPHWLSDLRTPAPFEPHFWGYPPEDNVAEPDRDTATTVAPARDPWISSVGTAALDQAVHADAENLVIAANYQLRWSRRAQSVDIRSALVTPDTAMALGQALLTAHDRMDFLVPGADGDHQIDEPGFQLEGWLHFGEAEPRADRDDERRGSTSGIPVTPASRWIKALGLDFDLNTSIWRRQNGTAAIEIAQWGDDDAGAGNGWRATASRELLTKVLDKADKSLLIYAEITRKRPNGERGRTRWAVCILDKQGRLERVVRTRRGLGRWLVAKAGMKRSVDTLGRWFLHRVAELQALSKVAPPEDISDLETAVAHLVDQFSQHRYRERY